MSKRPETERAESSILCLGEAIVDLVFEGEADSVSQATAFTPHFGGALANVAVAAARAGAPAALGGGVGADPWGEWLRDRLRSEGVDLSYFSVVAGLQTPVAFVTFDSRREPSFQIYGDGITAGIHSIADRIEEAVASSAALIFGSNTLVGEPERDLTMHARDVALERDVPVLFDPNIRPNRWEGLDFTLELCRELAASSTLVRVNLDEAALITGLPASDPVAAGDELVRLGAKVAVVTLGPDGALARGAAEGRAEGVTVDVVSPMGAGDAFMGTLAAGLGTRGWDPARVADCLPEAVAAGARACTSWGALA
jgi:sugar/nucleoside kinase (ribokinase family)